MKFIFKIFSNNINCNSFLFKGTYIKYVKGGRKVFAGDMKYFKYKLMDHEIFLKIFDGPQ